MKGFTLIELMIVAAIIAILAAVALPIVVGGKAANLSYGTNGIVETRCIDGFKFVVGGRGQPQQLLDENGRGVRCEVVEH